jgi:hypothetical protein
MIRNILSIILPYFALLLIPHLSMAAGPKISESGNKHNLSSTNTTVTYHADPGSADPRKDQICIFCHTPHNSKPQIPLWSHKETTKTFSVYSSATLVISQAGVLPKSYPGDSTRQPNGSSRLCLGCHDGLTALGAILPNYDSKIPFPASSGDVIAAFDLSSHHPVSFVYDSDVYAAIVAQKGAGNYVAPSLIAWDQWDPPTGKVVRLDRTKRVQCTACHDPHRNQTNDDLNTPFWVMNQTQADALFSPPGSVSPHDAVCRTCHTVNPFPTDPPKIK